MNIDEDDDAKALREFLDMERIGEKPKDTWLQALSSFYIYILNLHKKLNFLRN